MCPNSTLVYSTTNPFTTYIVSGTESGKLKGEEPDGKVRKSGVVTNKETKGNV